MTTCRPCCAQVVGRSGSWAGVDNEHDEALPMTETHKVSIDDRVRADVLEAAVAELAVTNFGDFTLEGAAPAWRRLR